MINTIEVLVLDTNTCVWILILESYAWIYLFANKWGLSLFKKFAK